MGLLVFIMVAAIPAWYFNRLMIKFIDPRRSFPRFLLYMAAGFATAFFYTFIFVWLMLKFL